MDNMTALVSCFARAYHCKNSERPVFADSVAENLLTAEEYNERIETSIRRKWNCDELS